MAERFELGEAKYVALELTAGVEGVRPTRLYQLSVGRPWPSTVPRSFEPGGVPALDACALLNLLADEGTNDADEVGGSWLQCLLFGDGSSSTSAIHAGSSASQ